MLLHVRTFWLPKSGNTAEEYEDAFECAPLLGRFAIADGATESSFAGPWARSLVQTYVATYSLDTVLGIRKLQKWLEPIQHKWHDSINWEQLPWFAEEKARAGAFCTFLGLDFKLDDYNSDRVSLCRWNAIAVGDCCLFQIRDDNLLIPFPIRGSKDFNNSPSLLSSNPANNRQVWDEILFVDGDYVSDDLLLLTTDALAQWFLARYEAGEKPWTILSSFVEQSGFEEFITHLRHEHLIRNDDTTLLIIHLLPQISASNESDQERSEN